MALSSESISLLIGYSVIGKATEETLLDQSFPYILHIHPSQRELVMPSDRGQELLLL